ncbi:hypothetical protein FB451DRAFT_1508520 [Mycena latifolia]|nr:hypothetical protein FB451DRAFT_1508520 [Mycena latifolia]
MQDFRKDAEESMSSERRVKGTIRGLLNLRYKYDAAPDKERVVESQGRRQMFHDKGGEIVQVAARSFHEYAQLSEAWSVRSVSGDDCRPYARDQDVELGLQFYQRQWDPNDKLEEGAAYKVLGRSPREYLSAQARGQRSAKARSVISLKEPDFQIHQRPHHKMARLRCRYKDLQFGGARNTQWIEVRPADWKEQLGVGNGRRPTEKG